VVSVFLNTSHGVKTWVWNRSWPFGQVNHKSVMFSKCSLYVTGFSLGGTSIAQNQLQPFIDQAIDQASICADSKRKKKENNGDPRLHIDQLCDWRYQYRTRYARTHISPRIHLTMPPGALRASLGHSSPFNLQFVEVGNEVCTSRYI
jgi:hypothetical protein